MKTIEIGISEGTGGLEKIVAFEINDLGATASGFDVTGLTDQRLAFQAALDNLPSAALDARTNRVLQLPAGRIRIDGVSYAQSQAAVGGPKWTNRGAFEIPSNVTIQGHPDGTTIIWSPVLWGEGLGLHGQRLFELSNVNFTPRTNIKFKDLKVCRNETALSWVGGNIMFYAWGGTNFELDNVFVDGGGRVLNRNFGTLGLESAGVIVTGAVQPIWWAGVDNFRLIDTTVQYSAGNSFGVELLGCRRGRIHNCKINKNSWDGLKTHVLYNATPSPHAVDCSHIQVTDTELNDNGYGIFFGHNQYDDITDDGYFYRHITSPPPTALVAADLPHNSRIVLDYSTTTGTLLLPNSPGDGRKISIIKRRPTSNLSTHVTTLALDAGGSSIFEMAAGLVWDNTSSGVFDSTANTRLFNLRWNQGISHDFNSNRQCITLTAWTNKWVVDGWGNGEGWDGMGQNITFTNCEARRNQGTGFQLKPVSTADGSHAATPASRAIKFIGCHAEDNSGHGFGIVNNLAGSTWGTFKASQTLQDILFESCDAYKNRESGFQFIAPLITNWISKNKRIRIINSTARSNMWEGLNVQSMFEDLTVRDSSFYGNGIGRLLQGVKSGVWLPRQVSFEAPINLIMDNVFISGIDPMEVGAHDGFTISGVPTASLEFAAAISSPPSPYVMGVGLQIIRRSIGHSGGLQAYDMAGCKFKNIKIENCLDQGLLWFVESLGDTPNVHNIATGHADFSQSLDDAIEWEDYYYAAGQATITTGTSFIETTLPPLPVAGWNGSNAMVPYTIKREDVAITAQPLTSTHDAGTIARATWAVDATQSDSPNLIVTLRNNAGAATVAPVDFRVTYHIRRA